MKKRLLLIAAITLGSLKAVTIEVIDFTDNTGAYLSATDPATHQEHIEPFVQAGVLQQAQITLPDNVDRFMIYGYEPHGIEAQKMVIIKPDGATRTTPH